MKIILFVLFCFLNRSTFAQIVLVPEPAVTVLTYLDQCQKIGYTCSHLFVIEKLKSADFKVGPDYLEIGSFVAMAALTGGDLVINNVNHRQKRLPLLQGV